MKLTKVQNKLFFSIGDSIIDRCFDKTYGSTSLNMWWKIRNEIQTPNLDSIEEMQRGTLENLQDEIN